MSRKDYVALAEAIRAEVDRFAGIEHAQVALENTAERIARVLYEDNPNFNREKFLYAALGA
jgi:hypothetical protein